ncbi:putative 2OG-Fe(II) oxygenase [Xylophilus sp. GOD-11R]|uniref:putative 2OG-Fe(II) oxygenase n=1 Tax=Xylophilus sp. GOD-11R TaxID=3089814 RepID=UPI00298D40BE|nr:putative 2OG-Fe(II) oxygenase [Xylophilus sp. GOD-11R]WPB56253.1 putative 2OG-Fe(II) oxygenase [Xylophilus sp. GOD-11R]
MATAEVFALFPTPVMRVAGVLDADRVRALREGLLGDAALANHRSEDLQHTRILEPDDHPELLQDLARRVGPHLVELGSLLFGESMQWGIKEMWVNAMQAGGRQALHNHANCFISGVLYLSDCDASANTVFMRHLGGRDFVFANTHAQAAVGPFNADKWIGPQPAEGDLLLFPSYLLHEVPVNRGGPRVTLAFNAIPQRLDAWGYSISFSS